MFRLNFSNKSVNSLLDNNLYLLQESEERHTNTPWINREAALKDCKQEVAMKMLRDVFGYVHTPDSSIINKRPQTIASEASHHTFNIKLLSYCLFPRCTSL